MEYGCELLIEIFQWELSFLFPAFGLSICSSQIISTCMIFCFVRLRTLIYPDCANRWILINLVVFNVLGNDMTVYFVWSYLINNAIGQHISIAREKAHFITVFACDSMSFVPIGKKSFIWITNTCVSCFIYLADIRHDTAKTRRIDHRIYIVQLSVEAACLSQFVMEIEQSNSIVAVSARRYHTEYLFNVIRALD